MHSTDSYYPKINKRGIYSFFLLSFTGNTQSTQPTSFMKSFLTLSLVTYYVTIVMLKTKRGGVIVENVQ